MRALSDVLPCSIRGFHLKEAFNASLFSSLKHLSEVARDVIGEQIFAEISRKLTFLSKQSNFSSFLYSYNYSIIKSVKMSDKARVRALFKLLLNDDFSINNKFPMYNDFNNYKKDVLTEICSFELKNPISFSNLPYTHFQNVKEFLLQGLEVLSLNVPEWYKEINSVVSEILILNAKNLKAGSSFDLFGLIYINHTYKTDKITDIISFLIHESSHLYIFLLSLQNSLVLNSPEERYIPPSTEGILRMDARPLIGIFHASFVLARIIFVLKNLYENRQIPSLEISYFENLIKGYEGRFLWGYEILQRHGKMTDLGQELILSSKSLNL